MERLGVGCFYTFSLRPVVISFRLVFRLLLFGISFRHSLGVGPVYHSFAIIFIHLTRKMYLERP